ncbi:MAG TPA: hypothetical protein VNZ52_15070 [Candidatus Thermoplasmatota archaeon]|nr:hypothetical protein [Candidatus Thermoplasmatota archaeon]
MVSPLRIAIVASLLVAASALAGCIGGTEEAPPVAPAQANKTDDKPIFENPDGRGTSAAANETNKTVVGKGGIEHLHDYWEGQTEKVIVDQDIWLSDAVFCDNKDTSKYGCYILRLPVTDSPTLVYEGTGRVEVTVSALQPWVQGLEMRYKNGANPDWGGLITLEADTPAAVELSAIETDMPHATTSQWAWKFIGNKAVGPSSASANVLQIPGDGRMEELASAVGAPWPADFHVTIKVIKSAKIVDWPGHPDFYAGKPHRVVMDRAAQTSTVGITDSGLYGDDANIVRPDLLISSGTGNLSIYINITGVQSPGASPNRYILEYTNATGEWFRTWGEVLEPEKSYLISIPVHYTGWDSPYAPVSAWQFRVIALYGAVEGVGGFCPGCFPYTVDYHMTIIAYPDPQYLGGDALEK